MADSDSIKLCECGCGLPAPVAKETKPQWGHVRGQPVRFRRGHNIRLDEQSRYRSHGMKKTRAYSTWSAMKDRCSNPSTKSYADYGGRGIRVCERWENSFENFVADMGHPPSGTSIERIDNDGNYEPENCKWATRREQSLNKRNSRLITYNGETLTVTEWTHQLGCSRSFIPNRLKAGWTVEEIFTIQKNGRYRRKK